MLTNYQMKLVLVNNTGKQKITIMNKIILSLLVIFTVFTGSANVTGVFSKPDKPALVVDNANVFSTQQKAALTQKLNNFNAQTSTQVLVYTTDDLQGYDVADFAQRLGQGWQVGQKGFDNGIVIVYKPKQLNSPGRVTIQTGYGIEPLIPDATANRIIDVEMIPMFKSGNIYQGIDKAVDICISLTKGEFKAKEYNQRNSGSQAGAIIILIVFLITFFSIFGSSRKGRYYNAGTRSNLPLLIALLGLGSSRSSNSGWGNFTSGSGGFGGGGSFGGFGGGSFGGGGASGSW